MFALSQTRRPVQDNQLVELSKDFDAVDVRAAEFLISGGSLLMLAADAGGTLRLFSYDLKSPASARGTRLLPLCAPLPPLGCPISITFDVISSCKCLIPCQVIGAMTAGSPRVSLVMKH